MDNETDLVMVEVPESALLRRDRGNRYGSVPGLDDSELADPDELERQVLRQEFGPVLALPVKGNGSSIRPVVDEAGGVDWGAFGTVDEARQNLAGYFHLYNYERLHQSLGYLTPAEVYFGYEADLPCPASHSADSPGIAKATM